MASYDYKERNPETMNTCVEVNIFETNPNLRSVNHCGATGLYDPDTKLTRFGVRDYDPSIGRWLQKDPIKFQGGTTNLYEYCGNDSLNCVDSSGLSNQIIEPINDPWAGGGAPSMCPPGSGFIVPTLPLFKNPPKEESAKKTCAQKFEDAKRECDKKHPRGSDAKYICYADAYSDFVLNCKD